MFKKILSLFLRPNCSLCKRSADHILCQSCTKNLKSCQLKNCQQFWQGNFPIFIWGSYEHYLKRTIAAFKYGLHEEIGEILGALLAQAWIDADLYSRYPNLTVVPIPLYQDKQKERGFNQAELIARRFCQITRYSLQTRLVKKIRPTEAMFNLNRTERTLNVKQAFAISQNYRQLKLNSSVLIIDDIHTTGATANQIRQILLTHQIPVLGVAAIAKPLGQNKSNSN